jgi:UDP-N-acetylglucosamine--N-acetylmuramyl-(pentapeptide) pyrophosphoryl-undecaprenol N-acetylglucosamine transferase
LFDFFKIFAGLLQAGWLMALNKPDVIFINGGSVGVVVAWAARVFKRPYLIHESDTTGGLANHLIEPHAKAVLIGLPSPSLVGDSRYHITGIPVRANFAAAKLAGASKAKAKLGLPDNRPILLITGGSQGAAAINRAVIAQAAELAEQAEVVHLCGQSHLAALKDKVMKVDGYHLLGFVGDAMADYLAAADVVIARAGASTLADLAYFGKASIIIPNPMLSGGHQLSNAEAFSQQHAVVIVSEPDLLTKDDKLLVIVKRLIKDQSERQQLSQAISQFARPDATSKIAQLILAVRREQ